MKILLITSCSIKGGAQKQICMIFDYFKAKGHDVYLIAPGGWLTDTLKKKGKDIVFDYDFSWKSIINLINFIKHIKPDVVSTFILSGACIGFFVKLIFPRVQLFITVNNPVIYDGIAFFNKIIYPIIYMIIARSARCFMVKSRSSKKELELILGKKDIYVIKNGIDFTVFDKDKKYKSNWREKLQIEENTILLTFVGAIKYEKGLLYLVEAIKTVIEHGFNLKCLLVGSGSDKKGIEDYIKKLDIQGYVFLTGQVINVNDILSESDIFILPSLFEGEPNALLEAMAMSLPCISTSVGSVNDLITTKFNGIIIGSESSNSIVTAVEWCINNKKLLHEMGMNAYRYVKHNYRIEVTMGKINSIFENYI